MSVALGTMRESLESVDDYYEDEPILTDTKGLPIPWLRRETRVFILPEIDLRRFILRARMEPSTWVDGFLTGAMSVSCIPGDKENREEPIVPSVFRGDPFRRGFRAALRFAKTYACRYGFSLKRSERFRHRIISLRSVIDMSRSALGSKARVTVYTIRAIEEMGILPEKPEAERLLKVLREHYLKHLHFLENHPYAWKLRYYMGLYDVTSGELSRWTGIHFQRINRIRNGKRKPNEEEIDHLVHVFGEGFLKPSATGALSVETGTFKSARPLPDSSFPPLDEEFDDSDDISDSEFLAWLDSISLLSLSMDE